MKPEARRKLLYDFTVSGKLINSGCMFAVECEHRDNSSGCQYHQRGQYPSLQAAKDDAKPGECDARTFVYNRLTGKTLFTREARKDPDQVKLELFERMCDSLNEMWDESGGNGRHPLVAEYLREVEP